MAHIEIDDDLAVKLRGLLLQILRSNETSELTIQSRDGEPKANSGLTQLIASAEYVIQSKTVNRYLMVLSWLYKQHPKDFHRLDGRSMGKRVLFSKDDPKKIEETGKNVQVKPIPGTPYFAMVTLDDERKQTILADVLRLFGYAVSEADAVAGSITRGEVRRRSRIRTRYIEEIG